MKFIYWHLSTLLGRYCHLSIKIFKECKHNFFVVAAGLGETKYSPKIFPVESKQNPFSSNKNTQLFSVFLWNFQLYDRLKNYAFEKMNTAAVQQYGILERTKRATGVEGRGMGSHLWTGWRRSCSQRCSWVRRWKLISADSKKTQKQCLIVDNIRSQRSDFLVLKTLKYFSQYKETYFNSNI